MSAAALVDGEVVWEEALGLADVESGLEARPDAQYRIGSVTKTFTAAAIMQLREAGLIDLDDPVGRHVPEAAAPGATIRRMLAHLAGYRRELPVTDWERLRFPDVDRVLAELPEAALPAEASWHYSNLAYALLGEVVRRRSGLEYEAYVRERLLEPLRLRRTTFRPVPPRAFGYFVEPFDDHVRRHEDVAAGAFVSVASLWSTPRDLCRWGRFLVEGEQGVLAAESAEEMRRLRSMVDVDEWTLGWGLGLMLMREDARVLVGHSGGMPGFAAGVAVSPKERSGAAVLVNSMAVDVDGLLRELAAAASEAVASPGAEEWRPRELPVDHEPLLGRWWWGSGEVVIRSRSGRIELVRGGSGIPPSTFEQIGPDRYRGVAGPEEGELLEVARDDRGDVAKVYVATYPLTRAPAPFGVAP